MKKTGEWFNKSMGYVLAFKNTKGEWEEERVFNKFTPYLPTVVLPNDVPVYETFELANTVLIHARENNKDGEFKLWHLRVIDKQKGA